MYCKNCGEKINNNDKYCGICGTNVYLNNNYQNNNNSKENDNTSLVFGIISMFLFIIPIISIPLAITAIILWLTNRKQQNITGFILGIISIILTITTYGFLFWGINKIIKEELKPFIENTFEQIKEEQIEISGNTFIADDNSIVEFYNNNEYNWYPKEQNNYNKGTYTVYKGLEAYNYAKSNLVGFNSYRYDINDFYLIIMMPTEIMVEGSIITETNTVYYYGEYDSDDKTLELYNHNTGKELNLNIYNNLPSNIDI